MHECPCHWVPHSNASLTAKRFDCKLWPAWQNLAEAAARAEFDRLNAIRQQRDADSMSGGPGETTQGTFGSSVIAMYCIP